MIICVSFVFEELDLFAHYIILTCRPIIYVARMVPKIKSIRLVTKFVCPEKPEPQILIAQKLQSQNFSSGTSLKRPEFFLMSSVLKFLEVKELKVTAQKIEGENLFIQKSLTRAPGLIFLKLRLC
jgi:hypothetical protein